MAGPAFRLVRAAATSHSQGGAGIGPSASRAVDLLRARGQHAAVVESTAGGLVNAAVLAVPGASRVYQGPGAVIYGTGDGPAPREALVGLLGDAALVAELSSPRHKATRSAYFAGKELWARSLARHMRGRLGATWCVAEGGATGPTFNVAGVDRAFSAIFVAGPVEGAVLVETETLDREANMRIFAESALELLADCVARAAPGHDGAGSG